MKALRAFEGFVMLLVLGVAVCFCFQLSLIKHTSVGEVFKGYLPPKTLVEGQGLYQACGILASSTSRANVPAANGSGEDEKYRPSMAAMKSCMSYSIAELAISLFTFALFVNSAILIVAGSSLYDVSGAGSADLCGIHQLLSHTLAPAAGTIFALALLLSGTSAGIVCTIAEQIVSEGQLKLSVKPWVRRLITRSISITPSIIIAGAVGTQGLSAALQGSQVALSIILPFTSAPLIYFTCRNMYMTVGVAQRSARNVRGENGSASNTDGGNHDAERTAEVISPGVVKMQNHWVITGLAVVIWGIIVVMNVALVVLLGLGVG
ncbi:NRAMP-like transporter smf-3 [Friedmanniomyces endolithicus]|nr:NRAMP-like transporter smf-3 [Friedmanniomyces endolithicus]